jgi:hypothetical protein
MATERAYSEDCCWNDPRDQCRGDGCQCRCHVDRPRRMVRRAWEILKAQDFDRLERENAALREALRRIADHPSDDRGVLDEWSEALAFKRCQEIAEEALTARRAAP